MPMYTPREFMLEGELESITDYVTSFMDNEADGVVANAIDGSDTKLAVFGHAMSLGMSMAATSLRAKPPWIHIQEHGPPEHPDLYLIFCPQTPFKGQSVANCDEDRRCWSFGAQFFPTHFMPLSLDPPADEWEAGDND